MQRIGLLYDHTWTERPGGASRFAGRILDAAPSSIEVVHCPPGRLDHDCDAYVLLLTKRYAAEEYEHVLARPFVRFEMDYWPSIEPGARWRAPLNEYARLVMFASPLHEQVYCYRHTCPEIRAKTAIVPPPLDPADLAPYREKYDREGRAGTIWYGEWMWHKAPDIAFRWALENRELTDFYSPSMPESQRAPHQYARLAGFEADETWWDVVARHHRFVFFPREPQGYPYSVLETYLLGLEVTIAGRFGVESFGCDLDGVVELASRSQHQFWDLALDALDVG